MRVAVANRDFSVALTSDDGKNIKACHQIANGEDLKLLSDRIHGVIKSDDFVYIKTKGVMGYLVEIEGQTIFVESSLMEVSQ